MPTEIERKYLVDPHHPDVRTIASTTPGRRIQQGYLLAEDRDVLRVRIIEDEAFLTYKGKTMGLSRPEFEYPIPVADAEDLIAHHCFATLRKTRHLVDLGNGLVAELDLFNDRDLALVEVELQSETQGFPTPSWFGEPPRTEVRGFLTPGLFPNAREPRGFPPGSGAPHRPSQGLPTALHTIASQAFCRLGASGQAPPNPVVAPMVLPFTP